MAREIHITLKEAPQSQGDDKAERRKEFRVYTSIVISIGLFWIFGFIEVLFSTVEGLSQLFDLLFNLSVPAQGLLIFGIYCLNNKVLGKWAGLIGICLSFHFGDFMLILKIFLRSICSLFQKMGKAWVNAKYWIELVTIYFKKKTMYSLHFIHVEVVFHKILL